MTATRAAVVECEHGVTYPHSWVEDGERRRCEPARHRLDGDRLGPEIGWKRTRPRRKPAGSADSEHDSD